MSLCLGIDVGGTNTDVVILAEGNRVIAKSKRPTTPDISTGIQQAVDTVIRESDSDPACIVHAMLGTTHATNAIVERKGLSKVGIIRLGAPSGLAIPPITDWPSDIVSCIGGNHSIVKGGYEYNGRPISNPQKEEIKRAVQALEKSGIEALAVSCVFSPDVNRVTQEFVTPRYLAISAPE